MDILIILLSLSIVIVQSIGPFTEKQKEMTPIEFFNPKVNETETVQVELYNYIREKEQYPGQYGYYKDRPQQLVYIYSQIVYERCSIYMDKGILSNPKFTEAYHKNQTRAVIKEGLDTAVAQYKKEHPFWSRTIDYYLSTSLSKKNIEEYMWIQERHNWVWFTDEVIADMKPKIFRIVADSFMKKTGTYKDYISYSMIFELEWICEDEVQWFLADLNSNYLRNVILLRGKWKLEGIIEIFFSKMKKQENETFFSKIKNTWW